MFKNVLIAEDHESINISLRKTIGDLGIANKVFRTYCDDAFKMMQLAISKDMPFDLLITDLSFEDDANRQKIKGGRELIKAIKDLVPSIKVIVFSIESRIPVVNQLFDNLDIDGYVRKARYDAEDLKRAIEAVYNNKKYRSSDLRQKTSEQYNHDFTKFDKEIITLLCDGNTQKGIANKLKLNESKPSSLSSIEKRLSQIRIAVNVSNNGQLIAFCKDRNII